MWWVREGTCSTGGDSYLLEVNVEVEDKLPATGVHVLVLVSQMFEKICLFVTKNENCRKIIAGTNCRNKK